MELINSNRNETGLAVVSQQPWAIQIRQDYGELPAFAQRFSPKVQKYCAQNMVKAVETNLPTFGRVVATYGEEGMAAIVATHITDAILRMGEDRDVDPYDVQFTASAICESDRFKTLRFTTVIGFFHLLKCGEFDIYGKITPRKILEAARKYAIEAQAKENRIAYEKENREARERRERDAANSTTWEQYAAAHGIEEKDWATYIQNQMKAEKARRDFWKNLAEVIYILVGVCVFIRDWQARQTNSPTTAANSPNFNDSTPDG